MNYILYIYNNYYYYDIRISLYAQTSRNFKNLPSQSFENDYFDHSADMDTEFIFQHYLKFVRTITLSSYVWVIFISLHICQCLHYKYSVLKLTTFWNYINFVI